eukprot:2573782-Prorocentrum_lima.AAC.1
MRAGRGWGPAVFRADTDAYLHSQVRDAHVLQTARPGRSSKQATASVGYVPVSPGVTHFFCLLLT